MTEFLLRTYRDLAAPRRFFERTMDLLGVFKQVGKARAQSRLPLHGHRTKVSRRLPSHLRAVRSA